MVPEYVPVAHVLVDPLGIRTLKVTGFVVSEAETTMGLCEPVTV